MAKKQKIEQLGYSGYFLTFEPGRLEKISGTLCSQGEASEAFSAMDWQFERREIALLSLTPGEAVIDAVVLMERMHGSGGTGKLKMRMWSPVMIDMSIQPKEINDIFPAAERLCTAETFRCIPQNEWQLIIDAIKRQRPELAKRLDDLIALRERQSGLAGSDMRTLRLSEQRDAVGLALDIASLDRHTILRGAKLSNIETATSVLDLLDHLPLYEQDLIRKDQAAFQSILGQKVQSGSFKGAGGREVRVHVFDKKPLESVLGIDLLIFLADFESYLLLQYKSMENKKDEKGSTWSYLVDSQIRQQIDSMNDAVVAIAGLPPIHPNAMNQWRLSNEAFYFKFCETARPHDRDDSLVAGITLGHDHLKRFLEFPEAQGDKGGHRVGYRNCLRYLNNTQFVELAREGWIGCDSRGLSIITEILRGGQYGGRAAMLAVIEGTAPKNAYERRKFVK